MAHIYTGKNISFQHGGKFLQAGTSHARFNDIVTAALAGDYDTAASLLDLKKVVQGAISGSDMTLEGSDVMFKGRVVPGILGQRILELVKHGHSAAPLQNFLSNLWENPSFRATNELYDFLEVANLPITEDGFFLAYKSVTNDFKDHHTGKMDNSIGTLVEMPRNGVDEDKDRTCSAGLHFAAYGYASQFGASGKLVVVKVNPKDVVAIPSDYNNEKGRACAYTILEEIDRTDNCLTGKAFVDTGTNAAPAPKVYVPQSDNYDDEALWDFVDEFEGSAEDFPINRKTPYDLYRQSNGKSYDGWFFTNYDVKNDNLVFRKHNGESLDHCTISDLDDWDITVQRDNIVLGS